MNIKCFSDLEKWMQGIVDQVEVAVGTNEVICFSLNAWHRNDGGSMTAGSSIWVEGHNELYNFNGYQELCDIIQHLGHQDLFIQEV